MMSSNVFFQVRKYQMKKETHYAGEGNSHPEGTSPSYRVKKTIGQLFQEHNINTK
jgi:hypothetical protein